MTGSGAEPPPEISEMQRLLDALAAQDVSGLGAAEFEARLRGLRRVIDRAECEFGRCLAPFDRGRMFEASGAGSTVSWLRQQADMDSNAASQRRRVALGLSDLPETGKGLRDGELSYALPPATPPRHGRNTRASAESPAARVRACGLTRRCRR